MSDNQATSWLTELIQKWNSQTYSVFMLYGNVFDVFPVQNGDKTKYVSLKSYLSTRMFKDRPYLLYYDISDGLTFGSKVMQADFFKWLEIYDQTEKTNYQNSLPKEFLKLVPLLRRFFMKATDEKKGVTLIIDFAEKILPESGGSMSQEERMSTVSMLKWGISPEMRNSDIGIILLTESISEIQADIVRNPYFAQVNIPLPTSEEREAFLSCSSWMENLINGSPLSKFCDFDVKQLANRTSGLNLVRIQHLLGEAIHNNIIVDWKYLSQRKKVLIEEYCQGLVQFMEPKKGMSLDSVATHTAAKARLREIAQLIKNGKGSVIERGILLPGRVGVGKSFLVSCFASECGLPVMIMGDFRSKWVGDTEKQLSRILMTIKSLGPIIVVIDEADAALGNRSSSGDSGVSSRVFSSIAAYIGDTSLRGRELWIAMTSRPDLLSIDMKRQGRFGLCIPLFPSQNSGEVMDLFEVVCKTNSIILTDEIRKAIDNKMGNECPNNRYLPPCLT